LSFARIAIKKRPFNLRKWFDLEFMGSVEQVEQVNGQRRQAVYWCFTLNNPEVDHIEHLEQVFRHECKWYVFREEVGEGTHLHGVLCLKVRQRMTQLRVIDPKISWRVTKSCKGSLVYLKAETAVGRVYSHGIELPKALDVEKPRGWQLQVLDIVKTIPDERTIHWFWEPKGNVGKSTLCKYLAVKMNALMLTGKRADMFHMLAKYPNKRVLLCVDCPRSMQDYIDYGAIEQIKNGIVFSNEGTRLVFNCPHVIVFSNSEPDRETMSADRWNIVRINA